MLLGYPVLLTGFVIALVAAFRKNFSYALSKLAPVYQGKPQTAEYSSMRFFVGFLLLLVSTTSFAITPTTGLSFEQSVVVSPELGSIGWSSPAVGDLNSDGIIDAVVGTSSGTVFAVSSSGDLLWSTKIPEIDCDASSSSDRLYSTPAIGSLNNDGTQQVVIGYGGFQGSKCEGGVVALNGSNGGVVWNFSIKKWGKKAKVWNFRNSVVASPTLVPLSDGKLAVGFGSFNRHIFLLNPNGKVRWVYQAADTVWSSPTTIQADSDARLELVTGSDISGNKKIKPITKNGGFVLTFDTNPVKSLVPFRDPRKRILQAMQYLEQVVYSSPVVGDVDPNSEGDEVVVGSGCFFPQNSKNKDGKWFKVLDGHSGEVLSTLDTASCSPTSAAIGDLNNDGIKDIITGVSGSTSVGGAGTPEGAAFTLASGQAQLLWKIEIGSPVQFQSPTIIEGSDPVVLFPTSGEILVVSGMTGETVQTLKRGASAFNNPAVTDFNNDGIPDLVIAGNTGNGGAIKFFSGVSSERAASYIGARKKSWRG